MRKNSKTYSSNARGPTSKGNSMSDLFEQFLQDPYYQELLQKLPKDERLVVIKALREITETFEKNLLNPIQKLNKQ